MNIEVRLDLNLGALRIMVADGTRHPPPLRLLAAAQALGHRTADGLGMLVSQGVIGLKLWAGIAVAPALMC